MSSNDFTYLCKRCGHEQPLGEICDKCGGDQWELLRLDQEGKRRRREARRGMSFAGLAPGLGDGTAQKGSLCTSCGTEFRGEEAFCTKCGATRIMSGLAPAPSPRPASPPVPEAASPSAEGDEAGLVVFSAFGRQGFARLDADENGWLRSLHVIIQPRYDECWPFAEGLAAVKLDGRWGYIDPSGTLVIPHLFEEAGPFEAGVAEVRFAGQEARIDKQARVL
jgi:hypothetical protein